jgi:thiol-disulfide isomerase/thioredoxin
MTKRRGTALVNWFACFALACSVLIAGTPQTETDEILEGRISQKDLSTRYAWFEDTKQKYMPDAGVVEALLPYSPELHFVVVMGTWCSDSRKQVPAFYSLMDALHISGKRIELIGVDRQKRSGDVDVARLRIEYVPTFIVYYKGKEIGRIVETPKVSLEEDLLALLQTEGLTGHSSEPPKLAETH